jgi:pyruvate dehydrogenase phosphatase regulatory subunit
MSPFISSATNRMPILKEAPYEMLLNTPDAFTPDGRWILGECPEIGNYYICAGMNGNSLQGAGGVGKAVADWMVTCFIMSLV